MHHTVRPFDPTRPTRRPRPLRSRTRAVALVLPAGLALATAACGGGDDDASGADPLRDDQWAVDELHLDQAHATSTGCGATIAVVDSGVDLDHPDLREHLVEGIDLIDGDGRPDDENGHGTHVAGIAAAQMDNGDGIVGAAPCAGIMPVRVLDAEGSGDDDTIAAGVRFAADHGADVINLSLGEQGILGRLRKGGSLNDAIRYADAMGAVVVAASGNEGSPRLANYRPTVPVLVVGAIDAREQPAEFSNYGDLRMLVAPGVGILSTVPTSPSTIFPDGSDGYEELDGTSMATPYVAGVAALLVAQGRDAHEVADVLYATAHGGGDDPRLGAGIVDAAAAVAHPLAADEADDT